MIKKFSEYINEDYFSKLASRKETCIKRKENEITEDFVRSFIDEDCLDNCKEIKIRRDNKKVIVDILGDFILRFDVDEIPFQFGNIDGSFYCCDCHNLKSLKGCPEYVLNVFDCSDCVSLMSLNYCPKNVGSFICPDCGGNFTIDDVKKLCKVRNKIRI